MKYRCKTCGTEGEGESIPGSCPACGSDELEAKRFDRKCPRCGSGYFEADDPEFCKACGNSLRPKPSVPKFKSPVSPAATARHRKRNAKPPSPRPAPSPTPFAGGGSPHGKSDGGAVWTFFKVLGCIVGVAAVACAGYYAVMAAWAVLCFIGDHLILSLIVFFFIVGSLGKSK